MFEKKFFKKVENDPGRKFLSRNKQRSKERADIQENIKDNISLQVPYNMYIVESKIKTLSDEVCHTSTFDVYDNYSKGHWGWING